ncbi:BnaCnng04460D [Brassica napus]|uniref:BnaCnng04460D protein n=1 Tax=Brassica napus TaxID=3708 RepID=A0A078FRZ7_BRANA|nr:BnaCnng04460D [Brassica napus]
MCPDFIQAFVGGLGIAGSLTSGLRLITKAIFDKSSNGLRKGALLSIRIATLIQLGCLILYVTVFAKLPIVKYYHSKAWKEGAKSVAGDLASVTSKSKLNRFGSNNSEKNTSAMVFIHLRVLLVFLVLPANTDFMGDSGCWCFTTITKTL